MAVKDGAKAGRVRCRGRQADRRHQGRPHGRQGHRRRRTSRWTPMPTPGP
ncbi:MAG: hypothetical protein MZW92_53485 [Comamonadaceae bacterium]|nr:hypothetical protein [Comamonadaceae bacterium]